MESCVIFRHSLSLAGIDDTDHTLASRVDMKVTNLHSLLMAPPMPIEDLDQIKLQPQELVSVGAP